VLSLASATGPAWVARALAGLDDVLVDHAHCEKKAASTALSLIFKYAETPGLAAALSALAREELAHFEQVLRHLGARGLRLRKLAPSPYAGALLAAVRPVEPERLLDTFLCMALIEARSCERMRLLADAVDDPSLAALWRGLLVAEARHHQAYVELAAAQFPAAAVRARLAELARHEAEVIAAAPPIARLHT
jgi:tRNA 2-(methylsulfanyl)-N6-isopentenyladenosine37 hydroxylase